ncbi:MAG: YncE family protein [Saprospiraceae bacterium]
MRMPFLPLILALFTAFPAVVAQKKLLILNRGDHAILSASLDAGPGSPETVETNQGLLNPYDLVFDPAASRLIWSDGLNHLLVLAEANAPSAQSTAQTPVSIPVDLELDAQNNRLYWVDNVENGIFRASAGGEDKEQIPVDSLLNPSSMAVFPDLNLLFYADIDRHQIWSSDLAGGNPKLVVEDKEAFPVRLAVDRSRGKIIWADDARHRIEQANFDGSDREVFYQGSDSERPFGLLVDWENDLLYWTDYGEDAVKRAGIQDKGPVEVFSSGLADPVALVIAETSGFKDPSAEQRYQGNAPMPRIAVYPNPADRSLTFASLQPGQYIERIWVFNTLGEDVGSLCPPGTACQMDIGQLPGGHYAYRAQVSGQFLHGRFSVIH